MLISSLSNLDPWEQRFSYMEFQDLSNDSETDPYFYSDQKCRMSPSGDNDLPIDFSKARSLSDRKRTFEDFRDSDPFSFLQKRDVVSYTAEIGKIINDLDRANSFSEIMKVIEAWEDASSKIKDQSKDQFQKDLKIKLKEITNETLSLDEEPNTLQKVRTVLRDLNLLNRRFGYVDLRNGYSLGKLLDQVKPHIEDKLRTFSRCKKGALTIIAEKVIARKKGQQIRDRIVTTEQVLLMIKNHLSEVTSGQLLDASRALARMINQMTQNPEKYKNLSLKLTAYKDIFYFYIFETNEKRQIALNFNCILQISDDEKRIELYVSPSVDERLGKGTFKTVLGGVCHTFDLKAYPDQRLDSTNLSIKPITKYKRKSTYSPIVLQTLRNNSDEELIDKGISLQDSIKKDHPESQFAAVPKKLKPYVSDIVEDIVYAQERYHTNLQDAVEESSLPLDFRKEPNTRALDYFDIFKAIRDVGNALKLSHQSGIIHNDVKPANIFVKSGAENIDLQGLLGDFDNAARPGLLYFETKYLYWDQTAHFGVFTPFTDVYGLAMSLLVSLIPEFQATSPFELANENCQDKHILSLIDKILGEIDVYPHNCDYKKMIRLKEEKLNKKIKEDNSNGHLYHLEKIHIDAFKEVIKLVGRVVACDQVLKTKFLRSLGPFWNFVDKKIKLETVGNKNDILFRELNHFYHIDKKFNHKIANWHSLTNPDKIEKIKLFINTNIDRSDSDELTKKDCKQFQSAINMLSSVIDFVQHMQSLPENEQLKLPLFQALKKPNSFTSKFDFDDFINQEIKKIKLDNCLLKISAEKEFESFDFGNEKRNEFKALLKTIIYDVEEIDIFRKEARFILDQIVMIENVATYAFLMNQRFEKGVSLITKRGMTMDQFMTDLERIMEKLDPRNALSYSTRLKL